MGAIAESQTGMVGCSGFEAATAAAFFGAKRSTEKRQDWQDQDQLENLSNQTKACSTSATKTKSPVA